VKYTAPHGEIDLTVYLEADYAIVKVADNGIGIPSEALPHVFDMFSQVNHNGEYTQGGLGIGLSLARQLAEMHGGTVSAASPGQNAGSTFTIRLPIADSTANAGVESGVAPHRPASARPLRILLADDNADAISMLAQMLELDGHEVRTASDGQQALALAHKWVPNLALLDLGMPKLNGFELAQAMRACSTLTGVQLAAVTGWGSTEDRLRTTEAGFDKHFTKPLDFNELRAYLVLISSRFD
jgi:CheY-like chemotaxis protein